MPALSWAMSLSDAVVSHYGSLSDSLASASNATNPAGDGLRVICAWPVSGQYGPGSRVLYYVLVAACVFARRAEWIKNACLAAALLLPAVAAVHGIVLAALHRDKAVDMDVYGAFQLCSIGILVAPMTVRLSKTYFNTPGRNTIFLWAGLILAGLLSLSIEFFRIQTFPCHQDGQGNPISSNPSRFPYGEGTTCGLPCSETAGPVSPMRKGSANNIYVIPAPNMLTFGTATLLAAACCVHAIVWMASMTEKVFESNWESRFGIRADDSQVDEPISGTNGATKGTMKGVNDMVRFFLSVAAVPVFGGAGLAILIVGEINFFSGPVSYQVEPIASIGQWAPIVGTGLAAIGSLYLVLAADVEAVKEETDPNAANECKCPHNHFEHHNHHDSPIAHSPSSDQDRGSQSSDDGFSADTSESAEFPEMRPTNTDLSTISFHALDHVSTMQASLSNDATAAISQHVSLGSTVKRTTKTDSGNRRKVAKMFVAVGETLGTKAQDWFDDSEFKTGKAVDWPEIPGESWRNKRLQDIRDQYNPHRDANGNATPLPRSRSRASSYIGSIRDASPQPGLSLSRSHSPTRPSPSLPRQQRASTLPETSLFGLPTHSSPPLPTQARGRPRMRRDTLKVPPTSRHNLLDIHYPEAVIPAVAMSGGRSSPPSLKEYDHGDSDREPTPPAVQATVSSTISSSQVHNSPLTNPSSS
ncbi:hypothetical protein V8C37DRAFT_378500 [Trichoderma ceciliae]